METPSKKRRVITVEEKKKIIVASESGKSSSQLVTQFKLGKSTVQTILANKAAILSAIDEGGEAKRAKLRAVKHEDLEEAVLRWIKTIRSQNVTVTGPLVMALQLAELLGIEGFKASEGWLTKFKHRHSITFRTNQGEAGEIDMAALGNWQQEILREAISKFSPDDVFNADETGLFWQLLPNKTLAFKGERCTSGKKSKERITVLVGSNMSGTEKLPLLVIGKSAKPRCFKNNEPPVQCKANKKAWMTADIFESWLKEWDRKLKRQNRKVLLFLDNFSGHTKIKLENITLKLFPPNTTAESQVCLQYLLMGFFQNIIFFQPCDQGIIENMKVHYRRFLLRKRISAIDDERQYKINLLQSLQFLRRSWDAVKPETLSRCFRKAGFVITEEAEEDDGENILADMDRLWAELQANNEVEGNLAEYLAVDELLETGGALTLAEIAEDVASKEVQAAEVDSDSEVVEIDEEEPPVTARELSQAKRILQRYADTITNPATLKLFDQMDDALAEERFKNMKQKRIQDYFSLFEIVYVNLV